MYIFNIVLDFFHFMIKNSHIKPNSVNETYLKLLVFVIVVTVKQKVGRAGIGGWEEKEKEKESSETCSFWYLRGKALIFKNTAFSLNDKP